VNTATIPADRLACLLRDAAAGMCADTAAVGLICAHGHFLHDPGSRRIIAAGSSITTGQPLAVIGGTPPSAPRNPGTCPAPGPSGRSC